MQILSFWYASILWSNSHCNLIVFKSMDRLCPLRTMDTVCLFKKVYSRFRCCPWLLEWMSVFRWDSSDLCRMLLGLMSLYVFGIVFTLGDATCVFECVWFCCQKKLVWTRLSTTKSVVGTRRRNLGVVPVGNLCLQPDLPSHVLLNITVTTFVRRSMLEHTVLMKSDFQPHGMKFSMSQSHQLTLYIYIYMFFFPSHYWLLLLYLVFRTCTSTLLYSTLLHSTLLHLARVSLLSSSSRIGSSVTMMPLMPHVSRAKVAWQRG